MNELDKFDPYIEFVHVYKSTQQYVIIGFDGISNSIVEIQRSGGSGLCAKEVAANLAQHEVQQYLQEKHQKSDYFQLITKAYGIIGCFRLLEHHYLYLITARQAVGTIVGSTIYTVRDVKRIHLLPTGQEHTDVVREGEAERRYRGLVENFDFQRDFYYSHTYHVHDSLQNNCMGHGGGEGVFDSMWVWNWYMSRDLRALIGRRWVIPITHGYFEQQTVKLHHQLLRMTLYARRSRYYAGTRYLKRGLNQYGYVANEVETEQIVETCSDAVSGVARISSMVQVRGSIPLWWGHTTAQTHGQTNTPRGGNSGTTKRARLDHSQAARQSSDQTRPVRAGEIDIDTDDIWDEGSGENNSRTALQAGEKGKSEKRLSILSTSSGSSIERVGSYGTSPFCMDEPSCSFDNKRDTRNSRLDSSKVQSAFSKHSSQRNAAIAILDKHSANGSLAGSFDSMRQSSSGQLQRSNDLGEQSISCLRSASATGAIGGALGSGDIGSKKEGKRWQQVGRGEKGAVNSSTSKRTTQQINTVGSRDKGHGVSSKASSSKTCTSQACTNETCSSSNTDIRSIVICAHRQQQKKQQQSALGRKSSDSKYQDDQKQSGAKGRNDGQKLPGRKSANKSSVEDECACGSTSPIPGTGNGALLSHNTIATSLASSVIQLPKPDIVLYSNVDPYYQHTKAHFELLTDRYGGPICVLNLIRTEEKYPRETNLGDAYQQAVHYLNSHYYSKYDGRKQVIYICWDFKKHTRQNNDALSAIQSITQQGLRNTDCFVFYGKKPRFFSSSQPIPVLVRLQHGVVRTNCIDCLDRTNFAQFALGLECLSMQLRELCVYGHNNKSSEPSKIDVCSSLSNVLMNMYINMGDCLALQYGQSEAHKETFQRQRGRPEIGTLTKRMVTNIKRLYNNTFNQQYKQSSMNLLLGVFIPYLEETYIWNINNDHAYHNPPRGFYAKGGGGVYTPPPPPSLTLVNIRQYRQDSFQLSAENSGGSMSFAIAAEGSVVSKAITSSSSSEHALAGLGGSDGVSGSAGGVLATIQEGVVGGGGGGGVASELEQLRNYSKQSLSTEGDVTTPGGLSGAGGGVDLSLTRQQTLTEFVSDYSVDGGQVGKEQSNQMVDDSGRSLREVGGGQHAPMLKMNGVTPHLQQENSEFESDDDVFESPQKAAMNQSLVSPFQQSNTEVGDGNTGGGGSATISPFCNQNSLPQKMKQQQNRNLKENTTMVNSTWRQVDSLSTVSATVPDIANDGTTAVGSPAHLETEIQGSFAEVYECIQQNKHKDNTGSSPGNVAHVPNEYAPQTNKVASRHSTHYQPVVSTSPMKYTPLPIRSITHIPPSLQVQRPLMPPHTIKSPYYKPRTDNKQHVLQPAASSSLLPSFLSLPPPPPSHTKPSASQTLTSTSANSVVQYLDSIGLVGDGRYIAYCTPNTGQVVALGVGGEGKLDLGVYQYIDQQVGPCVQIGIGGAGVGEGDVEYIDELEMHHRAPSLLDLFSKKGPVPVYAQPCSQQKTDQSQIVSFDQSLPIIPTVQATIHNNFKNKQQSDTHGGLSRIANSFRFLPPVGPGVGGGGSGLGRWGSLRRGGVADLASMGSSSASDAGSKKAMLGARTITLPPRVGEGRMEVRQGVGVHGGGGAYDAGPRYGGGIVGGGWVTVGAPGTPHTPGTSATTPLRGTVSSSPSTPQVHLAMTTTSSPTLDTMYNSPEPSALPHGKTPIQNHSMDAPPTKPLGYRPLPRGGKPRQLTTTPVSNATSSPVYYTPPPRANTTVNPTQPAGKGCEGVKAGKSGNDIAQGSWPQGMVNMDDIMDNVIQEEGFRQNKGYWLNSRGERVMQINSEDKDINGRNSQDGKKSSGLWAKKAVVEQNDNKNYNVGGKAFAKGEPPADGAPKVGLQSTFSSVYDELQTNGDVPTSSNPSRLADVQVGNGALSPFEGGTERISKGKGFNNVKDQSRQHSGYGAGVVDYARKENVYKGKSVVQLNNNSKNIYNGKQHKDNSYWYDINSKQQYSDLPLESQAQRGGVVQSVGVGVVENGQRSLAFVPQTEHVYTGGENANYSIRNVQAGGQYIFGMDELPDKWQPKNRMSHGGTSGRGQMPGLNGQSNQQHLAGISNSQYAYTEDYVSNMIMQLCTEDARSYLKRQGVGADVLNLIQHTYGPSANGNGYTDPVYYELTQGYHDSLRSCQDQSTYNYQPKVGTWSPHHTSPGNGLRAQKGQQQGSRRGENGRSGGQGRVWRPTGPVNRSPLSDLGRFLSLGHFRIGHRHDKRNEQAAG